MFIMKGIDRKIKRFLLLYFVRAQGEVPDSVKKLLPKLRNQAETEVKSKDEIQWINKVNEVSKGNFAVIPWLSDDIKKQTIAQLLD